MNWLILFCFITILIYLRENRKPPVRHYKKPPQPKGKLRTVHKADTTEEFKLNQEQQKLFELIENEEGCLFITGKAGTGKSLLLRYFKEHTKKTIVISAPTGVAALNVGGQTIHSLLRVNTESSDSKRVEFSNDSVQLFKSIKTFVIDEASMVRADLMDEIDVRLRQVRENDNPFGGVQVIMFGDLYQLPPVINSPELEAFINDKYGGPYFFNAKVWSNCGLDTYELNNVHRQKDEKFVEILNSIRSGQAGRELLNVLNTRTTSKLPKEGIVTLASTNKVVSNINHNRLSVLKGREYKYGALIEGNMSPSEYPTEDVLRLKWGAQVMLLKNDTKKRWVNGTIAKVQHLGANSIGVSVGESTYEIEKTTWIKNKYRYNSGEKKVEEVAASKFTQYPLKLAWAVTVHKSQGQTYESCSVNISGGVFAHGQAYVALSRCKSLNGLYLSSPIDLEDITVSPKVIEFMNNMRHK
jgi:ATP-dependent DNA helicase PIF1